MNPRLGINYHSLSQQARVITEAWIEDQMYCPSCESQNLERLKAGTRAADFRCAYCLEQYQAKSLSSPISSRIVDSSHQVMIDAIMRNQAPNLMILHYARNVWDVQDLILVPRHLLSVSAIEKRKPLSPSARGAGWVGCNIVLDRLPSAGRIFAVRRGRTIDPSVVRSEWKRFSFAKNLNYAGRTWIADVLTCVEAIGRSAFTLNEVYQFEEELSRLHPENRNIRPKIRQQLQVLRDRGIIRFRSPGDYEFVGRIERS